MAPLLAYARVEDWGVLVLVTPGAYLDTSAERAAAEDMAAQMRREGTVRAWRTSAR